MVHHDQKLEKMTLARSKEMNVNLHEESCKVEGHEENDMSAPTEEMKELWKR